MTMALLGFNHSNFIRKMLTRKFTKTQAKIVTSAQVLGGESRADSQPEVNRAAMI